MSTIAKHTFCVCLMLALSADSAVRCHAADALPGSLVDKRLLGEWSSQGESPDDTKGGLVITTVPEAYNAIRQMYRLPASWQPQSNDAVVTQKDGPPPWYLRCLNLGDGSSLILAYGGQDKNGLPRLAQLYHFTPISPRLDVEYYSSFHPPMEYRLTKAVDLSANLPGSLFDSQLIGKWEWADAQNKGLGFIEISTTAKAYEQFRLHEHFTDSWLPKPNNAVGLDAVGNAASLLRSYVLADGSKVLLVSNPDLEYYQYGDGKDPIKLVKVGFLDTETVFLRKANPQEQQKSTAESAVKAVTNNLRQIASAAQRYMLDNNPTEVKYSDVVGPEPGKLIHSITPVAGENYDDVVVTKATTQIKVAVPGVGDVVYNL